MHLFVLLLLLFAPVVKVCADELPQTSDASSTLPTATAPIPELSSTPPTAPEPLAAPAAPGPTMPIAPKAEAPQPPPIATPPPAPLPSPAAPEPTAPLLPKAEVPQPAPPPPPAAPVVTPPPIPPAPPVPSANSSVLPEGFNFHAGLGAGFRQDQYRLSISNIFFPSTFALSHVDMKANLSIVFLNALAHLDVGPLFIDANLDGGISLAGQERGSSRIFFINSYRATSSNTIHANVYDGSIRAGWRFPILSRPHYKFSVSPLAGYGANYQSFKHSVSHLRPTSPPNNASTLGFSFAVDQTMSDSRLLWLGPFIGARFEFEKDKMHWEVGGTYHWISLHYNNTIAPTAASTDSSTPPPVTTIVKSTIPFRAHFKSQFAWSAWLKFSKPFQWRLYPVGSEWLFEVTASYLNFSMGRKQISNTTTFTSVDPDAPPPTLTTSAQSTPMQTSWGSASIRVDLSYRF